jgi:FtsP/CotA-like multicopper oxidase with cupredoxin domain
MRGVATFAAGVLVGSLAVGSLLGGWPGQALQVLRPVRGVPTAMAPDGRVREFRLDARPGKWEYAPGIATDAWSYNGQIPGPELRVREGDLVRVIVTNHLPAPTTIHWHGVELNYKMDGVPGVSQDAIKPGQTFTYEFVAYPAGTRMYHSHQDTNSQLELGLYGALIIEPRHGPRYDAERTIILRERALDFTPAVALGQAEVRSADAGNGRGGALQYDLFLMDGKAGSAIPPIRVRPNQRVLLRLINLGNLVHAMHLHGHTFTIVGTDGNPVPAAAQLRKDTVLIGPGERYDIEVDARNPGVWMFHCHMPNHGENGMMTAMVYEGFADTHQHAQIPPAPARAATQPGGTASAASVISAPAGPAGSGRVVTIPMVDNRFVLDTIDVAVGTRVVWVNRGQNIHTSTSLDGNWDSPGVDRRGTFSFVFSKPGEFRYMCREHLLQGMIGTITVK